MKILLAAALLLFFCVAPANAARSSRPGACVSISEFNHIEIGASRVMTQRLLDGPGYVDRESTDTVRFVRVYRACDKPLTRQQIKVIYRRDTDRVANAVRIAALNGTHLVVS